MGQAFGKAVEWQNKKKHVTNLLIADDEKKHYCLINNMSRLSCQTSKHNNIVSGV